MAICRTCRVTIERLTPETWVQEGTIAPDGTAGDAYCRPAAEGLHTPALMTTIELLGETEPVRECEWCSWHTDANGVMYLVGGKPCCEVHIHRAVRHITAEQYAAGIVRGASIEP